MDAPPPPAKKARLAAGAARSAAGASAAASAAAKAPKVRGVDAVATAEREVLGYMQQFPRPFNATQLWENTLKVVSKANVQAALAALVAAGSVSEKKYGKQAIYYADPDAAAAAAGAPSPDDFCDIVLGLLPAALVEAERIRAEAGRLERRAAALAAEPTNADLDAALATAAATAADDVTAAPAAAILDSDLLAARADVLASRAFVTADEMAAARARHDAALARVAALRRVVRAVAAACAETSDEDVDVPHLAGVFADAEAGLTADMLRPLGSG